jgi:malate dehydrogenase
VPEGLVSSFPVESADGAWRIRQGLEVDEFAAQRIAASVAELDDEREAVRALGLIRTRGERARR